MDEIFTKYFSKSGSYFVRNISQIIPAMMRCSSSNTALIAKEMCKINGKNFKSNDTNFFRFLQSDKFQIDEKFWRMHINLLFDLLREEKAIDYDSQIHINIDYTTSCDDFLILSASVTLNNKSIILYFTSRLYPKRKNQMNQKLMEEAFIKGLRQVLSKKYRYVIVADRGFGNERFAKICEENNFEYVLRMNKNLSVKYEEKTEENLSEFDQTNHPNLNLYIKKWQKDCIFETTTDKDSTWFLLKSSADLNGKEIYEKRFKIEKLFQDSKSSGFDIENSKIKKYDRFKRIFYCSVLAHMFSVILGNFLESKTNDIKKNSALHTKTLSAFLLLDLERFPHSLINPSRSLIGSF
ncbi:MAG: transposase [Proteobacteria bacterium]|nr:transposase [Pseudomonadota bacterium]